MIILKTGLASLALESFVNTLCCGSQVRELKLTRASLEESRQALLQQNRHLEGEIHKCQSSLEEANSQCQVQMEKTKALKEKLVVQTKRKKASKL